MSYPPEGEGHRGAVEDEENFTKWLNNGNYAKIPWPEGEEFDHAKHAGGTTKTEDVIAVMKSGTRIKFSNKQAKSGISAHSHTWKNDSTIFTRLRKEGSSITKPFTIVKDFVIREIKEIPEYKNRRVNREAYDAVMKAANTQVRDNLTEELIEDIFATGVDHITNGADIIVIADMPEKKYYFFNAERHPVAQAKSLGYKIEYQRNPSPSPLPSMEQISNGNRDEIITLFGLNVGEEVKLEGSPQVPSELKGSICKINKIDKSILDLVLIEGERRLQVDLSLWPTPVKRPQDIGNESGKIFLIKSDKCIDLGLRLRVKHNNGVSDLFKQGGPAEKNKKNRGGFTFVSTIQQDTGTVYRLLKMIDGDKNLLVLDF